MSYYSTTSLNYNPLGFWRLGESTLPTAFDATANHYDGAITGGVTLGKHGLITGDTDTAMLFDGITGQITLPLVTTKTANILLGAWVMLPTSGGHGAIIKIGDGTSGYGLGIGVTTLDSPGVNVVGNLHGVANLPTGVSLAVGIKHHVAMVFFSGNCLFFVDGGLVATIAQSVAGAITPATACYIGNDPAQTTRHLNAIIDEPFIDDVSSLSTAQILAEVVALYQAGTSVPPVQPPNQTPGYHLLIGGKDRTSDASIKNLAITTSLQDKNDSLDFDVFDKGCASPINILDEVLILDSSVANQGLNLLLDPTLVHSPVYTSTNVQPQPPNSGTGQWTSNVLDPGVTMSSSPFTVTINNVFGSPLFYQWTQPYTVTPGQLYMFSAHIAVLSALTNANIYLELDFYSSTSRMTIGHGGGGGVGGLLGSVSQYYTTSQRATLQMVAPAGAAFAVVTFSLNATSIPSNGGSVSFSNIQLEPVWWPSSQSYPTAPDIVTGNAGCYIMPDGTTIRQSRIFAGAVADADPGSSDGTNGYDGNNRTWTIGCKHPDWLLTGTFVNGTYQGFTDQYMIQTLVSTLLPGKLSTNNVQLGIVIDERAYDDTSLQDVLTDLSNTTGFAFYVDYYYDVHYEPFGSVVAPYALSDTPDGIASFGYQYWSAPRDGTQIANAVIVKGGQATLTWQDSFTASGSQKQFTLTNAKPIEILTVTVNGVEQSKGVSGNTSMTFATYQCLIDFPNHRLNFQNNLAGGATVLCTYVYDGQLRIYEQDLVSIARYRGITIQAVVNDTSLTTTQAAVQRAVQYLAQYGIEVLNPHFKTYMQLIPGQSVKITNAQEGLSNQPYLVQQVTAVLMGNSIIEYEVTCGIDMPTFTKLHHRMHRATQKSKKLPGETFSQIGIVLRDTVTMLPESITTTIKPVTVVYGGTPARWGLSSWG